MKNWNPFSVFKYLTGSLLIHLTFFSILCYQGEVKRGKIGDLPDFYDKKEFVILQMKYSHLICLIFQLFEIGVWDVITKSKYPSVIYPSVSLLAQIVFY
jgi:hypothetical protein